MCWRLTANPTIVDSKTSDGTGTGTFVSLITPLLSSTTYHIRAYATNEAGTGYGSDIEFTTSGDPTADLEGDVVFLNGLIWMNGNKVIIKTR